MKKFLILALLVITNFTANAQTQTLPSGYNSDTGSLNLGSGTLPTWFGIQKPDHNLPLICTAYVPSWSSANFWTSTATGGTGQTAPIGDSDALMNAIVAMHDFSCGLSPAAKTYWGIIITVATAGICFNIWWTVQSIKKGEADPGEGFMRWFLRSTLTVVVVSQVCGVLPWLIISMCDQMSAQYLQQVSLSSSDAATAASNSSSQSEQHMNDLYYLAMQTAHIEQAARVVDATLNTPPAASQYDAYVTDINTQITAAEKGATNNTTTSGTANTGQVRMQTYTTAINVIRAWVAQKLGMTSMDSSGAPTDLTNNGANNKNYKAYELAMQNPPIDQDAALEASKTIKLAMYIASFEIGCMIWGLPTGLGLWAAFYAWPKEAGFSGLLMKGFTASLCIIIAVALIMVWANAAVGAAGGGSSAPANTSDYLSQSLFQKVTSFMPGGQAVQNAASDLSTGWAVATSGNIMGVINALHWQFIILGILIATAPGQAAGLMKGANAIGSSVKKSIGDSNNASGNSNARGQYGDFGRSGGGIPSEGKTRQDMLN